MVSASTLRAQQREKKEGAVRWAGFRQGRMNVGSHPLELVIFLGKNLFDARAQGNTTFLYVFLLVNEESYRGM